MKLTAPFGQLPKHQLYETLSVTSFLNTQVGSYNVNQIKEIRTMKQKLSLMILSVRLNYNKKLALIDKEQY